MDGGKWMELQWEKMIMQSSDGRRWRIVIYVLSNIVEQSRYEIKWIEQANFTYKTSVCHCNMFTPLIFSRPLGRRQESFPRYNFLSDL